MAGKNVTVYHTLEGWRTIPRFTNYEINCYGTIRSRVNRYEQRPTYRGTVWLRVKDSAGARRVLANADVLMHEVWDGRLDIPVGRN